MNQYFLAFIATVFGADQCAPYYKEVKGMCQIEPSNYLNVVALSTARDDHRSRCGSCVEIYNGGNSIIARVIDTYSGGDAKRILPGSKLYSKLASASGSWKFVKCPRGEGELHAPSFTWGAQSSKDWASLKILNVPNGIFSVQAKSSGSTTVVKPNHDFSVTFPYGTKYPLDIVITTYANETYTLSSVTPESDISVNPSQIFFSS